MKTRPLISCLCVTRNKTSLIKRAISCFKSQTYSNKELVIVYEDNDPEINDFVSALDDDRIRVVKVSAKPKLALGQLRNISIEAAKGEYFCQWDADDWFHVQRLEIQMDYIFNIHKPVCILTYWIIFDSLTGKAYLSRKRLWEGTILCRKSLVDSTIMYPSLVKSEDLYFVEKLLKCNVIYPLDFPHLYIYVYHGANTWGYSHFKKNFKAGIALSEAASLIIKDILACKYSNEEASELLNSEMFLEEMRYECELF